MKRIFYFLLALTLRASDPWSREDTIREVSVVVITLVDWGQTLHIAENPPVFYEQNFLLPKHPTRAQVNRHFAAGIIGHLIVSRMLPRKKREAFQNFSLGFEVALVANNYRMGIRVTF